MAKKKKVVPAVVTDRSEPYLEGVAQSLVDRIYGPDGLPWGAKLEELVDTVDAVRQMLEKECSLWPSNAKPKASSGRNRL